MLAYLMLALLASPTAASLADVVDAGTLRALAMAERDFDERRSELGLLGAAPLYGLETEAEAGGSIAARDFDARRDELGAIGSAPLYGLGEAEATLTATQSDEGRYSGPR